MLGRHFYASSDASAILKRAEADGCVLVSVGDVESALSHLRQVQFVVSWRHAGAAAGFALPHAAAAGGARTQRRSPLRGSLEAGAVFKDGQRGRHLERRCSEPGPSPGLLSGQVKGQLRGPWRAADPAAVHGGLLLRSWKKLSGKYALWRQNLWLTYLMLWNMFIYAAVYSENDILWLLKLRLSQCPISSVREESLNAARLQRQNSFSQLQLWRGKGDQYKQPGPTITSF